MGKRVTFTVTATSTADRHAVYELLRDGATWPEWSPIGSFALERPAPGGGEGVGAVRRFSTGFARSREEIVELRPDQSISYRALSGLPIRRHRADVDLADGPSGTVVSWREDFEALVPGTAAMLEWFLRRFVQRCADGLARQAAVLGPTQAAPS